MIRRTVIGSLPRLADNLDLAIKRAVKLQVKHEVNPLSDGEQRDDMIGYFRQIPGLVEEGGIHIEGPIRPLKDPSKAYKVREFKTARSVLDGMGEERFEVKTSITGPITLGFTCAARKVKYYKDVRDERLYLDLADALSPLLLELLGMGAWVQIDEPGVSAGYTHPSTVRKVLTRLLSTMKEGSWKEEKVSLHVCGDLNAVPNLLDGLLPLRLGILSFAFSGRREAGNIALLSRERFESNGKKLGVGCISVDAGEASEVEGVDRVRRRVREVIGRVGRENIAFLHPDCGLKKNTLPVAEQVLRALRMGTEGFVSNQTHIE